MTIAESLVVMATLIILSSLIIVGGIITSVELHRAPEGRQDGETFHYVWRNFTPDTQDVACIWATLAEVSGVHCATQMSAAA